MVITIFFSGKFPQLKFFQVVTGGAVASLEATASQLPLVQSNPQAKVAHLGDANF